jgi:hypothetical protein
MYLSSELKATSDGKAFYERTEPDQQTVDQLREALKMNILWVCDNILFPRIVPRILGSEKLDGATFNMPGGSGSLLGQWPNAVSKKASTEAEMISAMNTTMSHVRTAAYHHLSHWTAPGGRLVLTERVGIMPGFSHDNAIALLARGMGSYTQYWNYVGARITQPVRGRSDVEWMGGAGEMTGQSHAEIEATGTTIHALMLLLKRNTNVFNENPLPEPKAL